MTLRDAAERLFVRAFSRPLLSRATARLADLRLPPALLRPLVGTYVRVCGVDLSEVAESVGSFPTFNAFFTRRLRPGSRPVATEPGVVVSPCDSRVHSMGPVPSDGRLEQVKGRTYSVEALLADPEEAARFHDGVHAVLYLSPSMYHRVHAPVDGRIVSWRYVPGRLFPVNPPGVRQVEGLFTVNERVAIRIESEEMGPVAVVMVGAANVGRISLAFDGLVTNRGCPGSVVRPPAPIPVRRGDELGAFNLGSTVVLLVGKPGLESAGLAPGDLVRMGRPLWRPPSP